MPKVKIPKSVADRFKVTGTGKIMRRKLGIRHKRSARSQANVRRLKVPMQVTGSLEKKIKKLLGV